MKKLKSTIVVAGLIFLLAFLYWFITKVECASCSFVYNEPNFAGYCPEMCYRAPMLKIILFEITGDNFGYEP